MRSRLQGLTSVGFVTGLIVASLVWTVVVSLASTTPQQAARSRAAPVLPPPSAVLVETRLRQSVVASCQRSTDEILVGAPRVAPAYRSVVTGILAPGRRVSTGTTLARVADTPIHAVITRSVFYRDLRVGDVGEDVTGFLEALRKAGSQSTTTGPLTESAILSWSRLTGEAVSNGVIPVETLVAVPEGSQSAYRRARVGQSVQAGNALLALTATSDSFRCPDLNPRLDLSIKKLMLLTEAGKVPVSEVQVLGAALDGDLITAEVTPARGLNRGLSTVELRITVQSSDGTVLCAPVGALRVAKDGRPAVDVVSDAGVRTVPVEVGVQAADLVEISGSGLRPGTQVRVDG